MKKRKSGQDFGVEVDAKRPPLTMGDFERVGAKVPLLSDVSPHGHHWVVDLHAAGGIPAVMKLLLDAGLVDGSFHYA